MNISSSSTYTNAAYSSKGFTGLASGMDTESMVKAMLSGTQTKIDKLNASKQQATWKQEMYRDIITKLNTFQNKYFGSTSATNLRSSSLYNAMSASTKSDALRVTVGSSAAVGRTSVDVARLATGARIAGANKISAGISGTLDLSQLERTVTFTRGGSDIKVDLSGVKSNDDILQKLEDAGIDASIDDKGALTINGSMSVTGSALGLQTLGLSDGANGALNGQVNLDAKASITLNIDGLKKTIEIDDLDSSLSDADKANALTAQLNQKLKRTFGEGDASKGLIHFKNDGDKISLEVPDTGRDVVVTGSTAGLKALGLPESGVSNKIVGTMKLGDTSFKNALTGDEYTFKINDVEFKFTKDDTINDVVSAINKSSAGVTVKYQTLDDQFVIESKNTGSGYTIDMQDETGNLLTSLFGTTAEQVKKDGTNALVCVDGSWTERSSNSFTVNGMTMSLLDTTVTKITKADGTELTGEDLDTVNLADIKASGVKIESDSAKIDVTKDVDGIVDAVKSFVEDYNKLIEELNGYIDEDPDYKDYPPLTDEQRAEMSEKQIELWEEKAKTGLLRRDSSISSFLQSMRTAMYSRPSDSDTALYNIGIDASSEWRDKGKLNFDESKFRQALEQDSAAVENLFTSSSGGLADKFDTILKNTANTSSASPGTLVQQAGVKGYASEKNNVLYRQLKDIDSRLERLKDQYEQQKTRYWNQFNAMESYISNMNTQSAWLTQQLG